MVRLPQVAGSFYSANSQKLEEQIKGCFLSDLGPKKLPGQMSKDKTENVLGIIVPHAGYPYSGPIAAWAYLEAAKTRPAPTTIVLIGPNHTARGESVSIYPDGSWATPLGNISVNTSLSQKIAEADFALDRLAHDFEHSLEVQLPFLQFIFGVERLDNLPFQIVAVALLDQSLDSTLKLSESLARVLSKEKDFLIVATTDFTHYENEEEAHYKDGKLLEALQSGNLDKIYETAADIQVSACGLGAASTAIKACALLKADRVRLLKYETSAATTHDRQAVVGYASLSIEKIKSRGGAE